MNWYGCTNTGSRERDGFWLVEQYRYPIGRRTWEFPSGGWPHDSPGGDAEALALIASLYPGREAVAVPGATLALGGGGVHCITQQVPAA